MKQLNYTKATAFLAALALAIPAAHAAPYTWISSGNTGQDNNLNNTANWLLDGSPATSTPSNGNNQINTTSDNVVIFDSTNYTTTPRNIYTRNNTGWGSIVVPNGTINYQNDSNNQGNSSFSDADSGNTPTMVIGDGGATAATVNFNVAMWNGANGAKSYVINSDGTLASNRGGPHTWSNGTNYTLMRILGGTVNINGSFAESDFTAGQDDYVSFESLGSMFTFNKGGAGRFENDTDVTNAFGSIFRLGGSLNSGNAALDLTDGGTTWTITAVASSSPESFQLTITPATAPDTGFDIEWESQSGKLYNVRTSTDLAGAIAGWSLVTGGEDIAATPPTNIFNVDADVARRFFAVEEFAAPPPPPLLSEDFETGDGGFTVATVEGTAWERGTPDSSGLGGSVSAGNDGSANAWGTNLGTFSTAGADPTKPEKGIYINPTTTALRTPVLDLTAAAGAALTFAEAMDFPATDIAVVNIINATTDDIIAQIHVSEDPNIDNDASWAGVGPIDLAAGLGQQVRIEWRFTGTGGSSDDFLGWYIDDVLVTETTP